MNKNLQLTITLGLLFASPMVLAAEHGEHQTLDAHQIRTIIYQTINVSVMIAGMFYFLRNPIKTFFKDKKSAYQAAAEKAFALKKVAEDERLEIQVRLTKLESTADESVSRAKAEAEEMKRQLILEAKALSTRIREEAASAAQLESEKAKNRLREQMIREAAGLALGQIQSGVTPEIQKRLQGDFIENVRLVQP